MNRLIIDSLSAEIDRVRTDKGFTQQAKRLLERDRERLERLAKASRFETPGMWCHHRPHGR